MTVMPDPPYTRMLELMQHAEKHGFEYGWTYDSHILWQESYAMLPLVAERPKRSSSATASRTRGSATRRSRPAGTRRCRTSLAAGW